MENSMHAPQIAWIALVAASLSIGLAKHGEPREDYNFFSVLISAVIETAILIWGGFFGG